MPARPRRRDASPEVSPDASPAESALEVVENATSPARQRPRSTPAPAENGTSQAEGNGFAYGDQPVGDLIDQHVAPETLAAEERAARQRRGSPFPEPEDQGHAQLSGTGDVEYVGDLVRPGRIMVVAAEEGTGKSYAITGELAIRFALNEGSFAGTWPIVDIGSVLVLSEMHQDDDWQRQQAILEALGRPREALIGGLYRLPLMTAAGGVPALTSDDWRAFITTWCRVAGIKLMVFDTATGATQVEPWGKAILEVFRHLRVLLEQLPQLAIVLVVHMSKPKGRGAQRSLNDVLGEWGRWCDVVLLMERDGPQRVKLTSRKRVRTERMVLVTKRDGLLVEPVDLAEAGPKVPLEQVIAAIAEQPGLSSKELAAKLEVTSRTAQRYAEAAEASGRIRHDADGPRGAFRWFADGALEQLVLDAEGEE